MKELMIEAKNENLDAVLDFISGELEEAGCPMKLQTQVSVAVEEIFVNIAHYAYKPEVGGVKVRIAMGEDITIEFEDSGIPYDPLSAADPDITLPAEEREAGGLGILLVKKIMDKVEYRREGAKNILIVKKRLL